MILCSDYVWLVHLPAKECSEKMSLSLDSMDVQ